MDITNDLKFNVLEIFSSISGEAQHAGELSTFIRLQGCNLNCSYCDTMALMKENNTVMMPMSDIITVCKKNGHKHIVLTGGEPLMRKNAPLLIAELCNNGFEVEIETNGSIDFHPIIDQLSNLGIKDHQYMFTIDYKMGASNMEDKMNEEIFNHIDDLNSDDTIKFVIAEDDIEHCMELIEKFEPNSLCKFYISPVFGQVNMEHIIEAMKKHNMGENVRYQLQIHKYVWDPNKTGV